MDTAVVVALLVVIALLIGLLVLTSLQFFKALQAVLLNADRAHDRTMRLMADTQDRFMALDFASFKAMQLAQSAEEGWVEEQAPDRSSATDATDATVTQEEPSVHRRWFASPQSEASTVVIPPDEMEEIERRERARENR